MPDITFRAKVETIYNMDDTIYCRRVKVPKLASHHCDMQAFRTDRNFGDYANSDLFPAILKRATDKLFAGNYIQLNALPAGVAVDTSGFLVRVTISVDDWK